MPITPPPGSGRPRRLTDRERRALSDIETELVRSDPRLGSALSRRRRRSDRAQTTADRIVQGAVVIALCLLFLPGSWAAAVIVWGGLCAAAVVVYRRFDA